MQNSLPLEVQQLLETLCKILVKRYYQDITEDQAHQQLEELNKQIRKISKG